MKAFAYVGIICVAAPMAVGQPPVAPAKTVGPRQPGGFLGELGTYLTIEGVLVKGLKVESPALLVDTVNGKKLDKPVPLHVRNVRNLPAKQRCVLKGYELGGMIGRPPAEYAAAREQGQDAEELAKRDALVWQWRPYFVALIAVEPEGLELFKP
jgi:hypothetical protein